MTSFLSPSLALDHYSGTWYLSHEEECAVGVGSYSYHPTGPCKHSSSTSTRSLHDS